MSQLSPQPRAAYVTDDAPEGEIVWTSDERTGALHMRAPLTWTGVREYPKLRVGDRAARILRRPEQVRRPGYLRTIERIPPTLGHPSENGASALITPQNYSTFAVGSVGDKIEIEVIDGYPVPVGNVTVNAAPAIEAILAGNTQVSQGFFALIAPPPMGERRRVGGLVVGSWQGPHGPEEYDFEHICDPDHSDCIEYEKENPDFRRGKVGANHLAVGIPAGRGLAQAQARPAVGYDSAPPTGAILFLDTVAEVTPVKTLIKFPKIKIPRGLTLRDGSPIAIPVLDDMEVEAEDSPELVSFLTRLAELASMMAQELAAVQVTGEEAASVAEAAQGEAAAAQGVASEAQAAQATAVEAADALTAQVAKLEAEVAPLRAQALAAEKEIAGKVAPGVGLDAADSIAAVRKAAVIAKMPVRFTDASSDAEIQGAWTVLSAAAPSTPAPSPGAPSPGFMAVVGEDGKPRPSRAAALFGRKAVN